MNYPGRFFLLNLIYHILPPNKTNLPFFVCLCSFQPHLCSVQQDRSFAPIGQGHKNSRCWWRLICVIIGYLLSGLNFPCLLRFYFIPSVLELQNIFNLNALLNPGHQASDWWFAGLPLWEHARHLTGLFRCSNESHHHFGPLHGEVSQGPDECPWL